MREILTVVTTILSFGCAENNRNIEDTQKLDSQP